jgi:Sulfotransferase domain
MSTRWPDFFLVGAPKCGTTTLFRYLEANEALYLAPEKEPGFFCTDLPFRHVTREQDYAALFAAADKGRIAGEASPWYLYSRAAVPSILERNPKARFIVLLRDPGRMAVSLYHHHRRAGIEPAPSFAAAWRTQAEGHLAEHWVAPRTIPGFPYADVCTLGRQLRILLEGAGEGRVLPLLLEDLAQRPAEVLCRVSDFLDVPVRLPERFATHNASRVNRSELLTRLWYGVTRRGRAYWHLKHAINALGLRPGRWLFDRVITREADYQPAPAWLQAELRARFTPDISLLEQLLGRRLNHWLAVSEGT